MPASPDADTQVLAVVRDFFCEHTPTKSRVLALLAHNEGPASLKAILTVKDACLAQQVAEILRSVLACGSPVDQTILDQVEVMMLELPDPVVASLKEAVDRARTGGWLIDNEQLSWAFDQRTEVALNAWRTRVTEHNLAKLNAAGPVVRHVQYTEHLVTDLATFFNSATSLGWRPSGFSEHDIGDPIHYAEAMHYLAHPNPDLPGAQLLSSGSSLRVLDPDDGDELADWDPTGFQVDFGPGWLTEHAREPSMSVAELDGLLPVANYTALFPLTRTDAWQFTPRTAYLLSSRLGWMADQASEEADTFDDGIVREEDESTGTVYFELPRTTWTQSDAWRLQFARAILDLSQDIDAGIVPRPRCVAERVALDLALDAGEDQEDLMTDNDAQFDRLPRHRDDDWRRIEDALLLPSSADAEFPPLWDTPPEQWFEPFPDSEPRDPNRGYPTEWNLEGSTPE